MSEAVIVADLKKDFRRGWRGGTVAAVKGISFAVSRGEAFGFIGPNGAGKSTTIKILTGVMQATAGTARIFGIPVGDPAARAGLGYVPENPYLYDYLTPLEILVMGLRLHGTAVADVRAHLPDLARAPRSGGGSGASDPVLLQGHDPARRDRPSPVHSSAPADPR